MKKGFTMVELIMVITIALILLAIPFIIIKSDKDKSEIPCEKYKNFSVKDIPVRCLDYFKVGGGEF